jgi:hypothetical protein
MRQVHLWPRVIAGAGLAWGVATVPTPAHAIYQLVTQIPVPPSATNPFASGQFNTYDISFFDPTTQLDYVRPDERGRRCLLPSDKQIHQSDWHVPGIQPVPPASPANNAISGPDGVGADKKTPHRVEAMGCGPLILVR